MLLPVLGQISKEPDYFKCSEFAINTQTGVLNGIEIVRTGGTTKTLYNRCKDFSYLYVYSCNNIYPATPVMKKCDFVCVNDGCAENFAAAIKTSPYFVGKFSKIKIKYNISEEYVGEPEIISERQYKRQLYEPFAKNFVCSETDNGTDLFTSGKIKVTYNSGIAREYSDLCRDKHTLAEYRCDVANPSRGASFYCQHGCLRGACQNQTYQGHYGVER